MMMDAAWLRGFVFGLLSASLLFVSLMIGASTYAGYCSRDGLGGLICPDGKYMSPDGAGGYTYFQRPEDRRSGSEGNRFDYEKREHLNPC